MAKHRGLEFNACSISADSGCPADEEVGISEKCAHAWVAQYIAQGHPDFRGKIDVRTVPSRALEMTLNILHVKKHIKTVVQLAQAFQSDWNKRLEAADESRKADTRKSLMHLASVITQFIGLLTHADVLVQQSLLQLDPRLNYDEKSVRCCCPHPSLWLGSAAARSHAALCLCAQHGRHPALGGDVPRQCVARSRGGVQHGEKGQHVPIALGD